MMQHEQNIHFVQTWRAVCRGQKTVEYWGKDEQSLHINLNKTEGGLSSYTFIPEHKFTTVIDGQPDGGSLHQQMRSGQIERANETGDKALEIVPVEDVLAADSESHRMNAKI